MDKEKQAFDFVQKGYELCWKIEELEGSELQTEIITMAEEYTNRAVKDIAALKAEVERLNSIVNWEKTEAEYYAKLGKENDRLEAEIERKDMALRNIKGMADDLPEKGLNANKWEYDADWALTQIVGLANKALLENKQ